MENTNKPQVTTQEIKDWENKFRESVSTQVQFDVDQNGEPSMKLYNGESGVEASWAGTILLGSDNYIKWSFSIQNGIFIESKLTLDDQNILLYKKTYDFYNSWKEEWSKQLTIPDENRDDTDMQTDGGPASAAPAPATAPMGDDLGLGGNLPPVNNPVNENKRNKQTIINESRERMMRLAQVWKK